MKNLIFIGGAMGTGKTTVSYMLTDRLKKSVMLDGDWTAWQGCSWNRCRENIDMQLKNIYFLLNSFMKNDTFENIIFCWALSNKDVYDSILKKLNKYKYSFYNISLICDKTTLYDRMLKREILDYPNLTVEECKFQMQELYSRSLNILSNYSNLDTVKIDTSKLSKNQVLKEILEILSSKG